MSLIHSNLDMGALNTVCEWLKKLRIAWCTIAKRDMTTLTLSCWRKKVFCCTRVKLWAVCHKNNTKYVILGIYVYVHTVYTVLYSKRIFNQYIVLAKRESLLIT